MKATVLLLSTFVLSWSAIADEASATHADLQLIENERVVVELTNDRLDRATLLRSFKVTGATQAGDKVALLDQLTPTVRLKAEGVPGGAAPEVGRTKSGPAVRFAIGEPVPVAPAAARVAAHGRRASAAAEKAPSGCGSSASGCGAPVTGSAPASGGCGSSTGGCGSPARSPAQPPTGSPGPSSGASAPASGGCGSSTGGCGSPARSPAHPPTGSPGPSCGCGSRFGTPPLGYQAELADPGQADEWARVALKSDHGPLKVGQRASVKLTAWVKPHNGSPLGYAMLVPKEVDGAKLEVVTGPEGAKSRELPQGTLYQGEVGPGGAIVEMVLAVTPTHASLLRLNRVFQFATRLPKPVGGPAWLKTERTVEHQASSIALFVGSVKMEVEE